MYHISYNAVVASMLLVVLLLACCCCRCCCSCCFVWWMWMRVFSYSMTNGILVKIISWARGTKQNRTIAITKSFPPPKAILGRFRARQGRNTQSFTCLFPSVPTRCLMLFMSRRMHDLFTSRLDLYRPHRFAQQHVQRDSRSRETSQTRPPYCYCCCHCC